MVGAAGRLVARVSNLTFDEVNAVLRYEDGRLYWRATLSGRAMVGGRAGCLNHDGYRRVQIRLQRVGEHRLVWLLNTGRWPPNDIDHLNCDRSDNRIENLREATRSQNMMNTGKPKKNTSGYKGVHWRKDCQKWESYIKANGKKHHLGFFDDAETAGYARQSATLKLHGDFARTVAGTRGHI